MKKIFSIILTLLLAISLLVPVCAAEAEIPYDPSWLLETTSDIGGTINKIFDGNASTFWHTRYSVVDGKLSDVEKWPHYITVNFISPLTVSGLIYTPRSDSDSGTVRAMNVYSSTDGETFTKIAEYKLAGDAGRFESKTISWGNKEMTAIKIEVTNSYGSGYASCGELKFLTGGEAKAENAVVTPGTITADGKKEEEAPYEKIPYDSSWLVETTSDIGGTINKIFDGNPSTFWHTHYTVVDGKLGEIEKWPHYITVNFVSPLTVSGLIYTPRSDSESGTVRAMTVYGTTDGEEYKEIFKYKLSSDAMRHAAQTLSWGDMELLGVKIEITDSYGTGYATCGELEFIKGSEKGEPAKDEPKEEKPAEPASDFTVENEVPKAGWKATADSEFKGAPAKNLIDGKQKTIWHSYYEVEDGKAKNLQKPPYTIDFTLPELTKISEFVILPRTDSHSGDVKLFDLQASGSDDGAFYTILENESIAFSQTAAFGAIRNFRLVGNIEAKRIRLIIKGGNGNIGSFAEFSAVKGRDDLETVALSAYQDYEVLHRLYQIPTEETTGYCAEPVWNNNTINRAFDGRSDTIWQTETTGTRPVTIEVEFREIYKIKEFHYLPRRSEDKHGLWYKAILRWSVDGLEFSEKEVTFADDVSEKVVVFDEEIEAKYFDIEIVEYNAGRVSATDISFFESGTARKERTEEASETYTLKIGDKTIKAVKGKEKTESEKVLDVAPFIVNGSTLIPLRGLVEEMGAEITWDGAKEKITLKTEVMTIELQIWNNIVWVTDTRYPKGKMMYTLLNPPVISENRTFIPVRFVSEILGYNVSWNGEAQTVTITK
ncbi:MAG: discoidin domain-containing protein [Clostridia bacterium]|nr:discoidin domain-containing protein [Clostridia bacterium]